jgi:phosphoglycolate phosphatase
MVGDNYHDVEAAHSVGLPAIMVTYGYSHKPPASVGADYLVDEMPAIIPILRQRGMLCQ